MAGMIPGVGVASRRRTFQHHRLEDSPMYREPSSSIRERLEPSMIISATAGDMDETVLKARRRLEQKLGYHRSASRTHGGGCNNRGRTKERQLGSKILWRPWNLNPNNSSKCKSDREVCAVCLENFGAEKQLMDLSCSHKYHSQCLLPWLAAHPHCPYCRSPVQV